MSADWREDSPSVLARRCVRAFGGSLTMLAAKTGVPAARIGELYAGALVTGEELKQIAAYYLTPRVRYGLRLPWRLLSELQALAPPAGDGAPTETASRLARAAQLESERQDREQAGRENLAAVEAELQASRADYDREWRKAPPLDLP